MDNVVFYFEIPVSDMDRAIAFYNAVFEVEFQIQTIDEYQLAHFPGDLDRPGCSGALAKGDIYNPSRNGSLIYFDVVSIDKTLDRISELGSTILLAKTFTGESGYVAEFEDSEGNRVGLTQAA